MTNWNGFKGRAKRLDDVDLPKIGATIGVGEDEIHAVMDVEAAGSGFDKQGRPRILFERHWFHRLVPSSKRAKAIQEGLAVSKWSRATYGQDQYALLARAMKIDEDAALMSASWGLGQVMGFNHAKAGYATVQDMVRDFMDDEEKHLAAMIAFIKSAKLDGKLRAHDWAGFAKGYNGAGYRQNRYDEKLASAYRKWSKIKDTPYDPAKWKEEKEAKELPEAPLWVDDGDPYVNPSLPQPGEEKRGGGFLAALIKIIATIFGARK